MTESNDRDDRVASCFGQGINPKEAINDYGDEEGDHNADEKARSWENTDVDDDSKDYVVYRDVE